MNNQSNKGKKCTHMSAAKLRAIRKEIGFDMRSMARVLDGMPYRTYQDYEYGKRGIPESVAAAVRDVRRKDREVTRRIIKRMESDLDRQYPRGIPSENSIKEGSDG